MKELLKKFKNFKLTAIIEACAGAVSVIAALLILIFYQTNQTRYSPAGVTHIPGFPGEPIAGMVFFLAGLLAIIFGVVTVYACLPFIFKKEEKLEPNRLIPWFGVTTAGFSLIEVIFAFVMVSKEGSRHTVPVIIVSVFLILALVVHLLMIYPTLKIRLAKDE